MTLLLWLLILIIGWTYTLMGAGFAIGFLRLTDANAQQLCWVLDFCQYLILAVLWPLACGLYIGGGQWNCLQYC